MSDKNNSMSQFIEAGATLLNTVPKEPQGVGNMFNDLSKYRINQDFTDSLVQKAILHVPVRKPTRQEFIRVHPDENMRLVVPIIELKEEREHFIVPLELAKDLADEVVTKLLVTAINKQGVLFVWPITLSTDEDRKNHWNETARMAANLATKAWVRVKSNMSLGAYEVHEAKGGLQEPQWPDLTFAQILEIAFKGNLITSSDHIAIRKLRGEM